MLLESASIGASTLALCALLSASYLMRRWWFRASLWRAYDFRFRSFCRIRRASEGSCRVRLVGSIVYWIVGDVVVLVKGEGVLLLSSSTRTGTRNVVDGLFIWSTYG